MEGVQLYLELIDFDAPNEDDLIDRFIIDVTVPIGSSIDRYNVRGIFGFAEVSVNFEARCKQGYTCEFYETEVESNFSLLGVIFGSSGGFILLVLPLIVIILYVTVVYKQRGKIKSQSSLSTDDSEYSALVSYNQAKLRVYFMLWNAASQARTL